VISILIVAEVRFYREGLEQLLPQSGDLRVLDTVGTAQEALTSAALSEVDIVLLDTSLAGAVDLLARLRSFSSPPRVVALAISETPQDVLPWAEAGISGYVAPSASLEDVRRMLRSVMRDELPCAPHIAASMLRRLSALRAGRPSHPGLVSLTLREREILELMAEGMANKSVASRLGISLSTAKNHVHNILDKLRVRRRVEAAALYRRRPRHSRLE
jgi:two-component system nitrate/nitrite response regulator NarL